MKKFALHAILLMLASLSSSAQIPQSLSYQGFLQNNGQPVNGNLPMTFRLYTQPTGGTEVWSQSYPSVVVTNGMYTVLLDVPTMQFDTQYWLQTEISGQVGSTRTQLTSAPYSLGPWGISSSTAQTNPEEIKLSLSDGSPRNIFYNNGNVGIGTSNPSLLSGGSGRILSISDPLSPGLALTNTDVGGKQFFLYSGSLGTVGSGHFGIYDATSSQRRFIIGDNGNVGIGIPGMSTGVKLHLVSSTQVCDLRLQNTGGTPSQWKIQSDGGLSSQGASLVMYSESAGAYRMVINGDGDVGIGTPTPGAKLHLQDPGSVCDFRLQNVGGTPGLWKIQADGGLGGQGASLVVYSETAAAYRMVINGTGNIGIGTTTPTAKLDVVGRTKTQTLEITGGSDLAEPFDMETSTEPGTVMVIDADNPGRLRMSSIPYDQRVAGIVSGAGGVNPGLTLRQEGVLEGTNSVAIAGRVYCKAEALSRPIHPGDLLTTSNLAGHAMSATDMERSHGAIIGKAMTSLPEGTGLVLVLVNLQ